MFETLSNEESSSMQSLWQNAANDLSEERRLFTVEGRHDKPIYFRNSRTNSLVKSFI
jgi:hypothetical protein